MRRTESPRCILWVPGAEPLEPTAEAHPSPPRHTAQPHLPVANPNRPVLEGKLRAGPGGSASRGLPPLLLPKQEVAVFRKCQLIPSCCCQKGEKKEKTLLGFKETHNNFRKPREHDGCVHSPEYSAEARGPRLSHAVWSHWKWAGWAGALAGAWRCSPGANARLPGRQRLFSLFIPRNNGS